MYSTIPLIVACCLGGGEPSADLATLAKRLASDEPKVRLAAAGDLLNGHYRQAPPEALMRVLIDQLQKPTPNNTDSLTAQGFVMEHLARHFGEKARAVLPLLLELLADDKQPVYLRGQAIRASARIGPGDPEVVKAFIVALENPNPTTTSGVHDYVIELLGDMGEAAWPAKKAIARMLEHPWYADRAFDALGKLARDDPRQAPKLYIERLRSNRPIAPEDAAAAMLHLTEASKVDRDVAAQTRTALLAILAGGTNDHVSRAAMRVLAEIGPGSSAEAARAVVRGMFTTWRNDRGDMAGPAEQALKKFEATEPEAVPVFVEAFADALKQTPRWTLKSNLALALSRYGKDARPAAADLVAALGDLPPYAPGSYGRDLLEAYTELAAAIGPEPRLRARVLELLDPDGKYQKSAGQHGWVVSARLLLTLSRLGLPADEEGQRTLALRHLERGLQSEHGVVFGAAAQVIVQNTPLRPEEIRRLVPLLADALRPSFKFEKMPQDAWLVSFRGSQAMVGGPRAAIAALAALGPAAEAALPALEAIAKRPLQPRESDFLPESPKNQIIREAAKAAAAVRGEK